MVCLAVHPHPQLPGSTPATTRHHRCKIAPGPARARSAQHPRAPPLASAQAKPPRRPEPNRPHLPPTTSARAHLLLERSITRAPTTAPRQARSARLQRAPPIAARPRPAPPAARPAPIAAQLAPPRTTARTQSHQQLRSPWPLAPAPIGPSPTSQQAHSRRRAQATAGQSSPTRLHLDLTPSAPPAHARASKCNR
nr:predicted GPI-anchored protein 58 [Lolium perenne]